MMARSITLGLVFLVAAAHVSARPATAARDACKLLTKRDVAAVQGQAFSDARLTDRGNRSQCFFELPTFVDSVSLDVIRDGGALWNEYFALEAQDERERTRAEQGKKKKSRPQPVPGIGQEAYWVGAGSTGSLYVRKKDVVLRVSAAKALGRL